MRLMSWNVNGLRAVLKKGFMEFLEEHQPDVLCLQEIKARQDQVDFSPEGYEVHWNPAEKAGYSGTAILTRKSPLQVKKGMGRRKHDGEGRVLAMELDDYWVITVYTPNAQRDLARHDYRTKEWDVDFLRFVRRLEKDKPVIFCGDLNVSHQEIDLANPGPNKKNAGFTPEERRGFDRIVKAGFIDTFREFEPGPGHYTWWTYRGDARSRNIG